MTRRGAASPGSTWYARADAIGRTTRALAAAGELPGASDYEAATHPVGRAWVRRVGSRNLRLWYRFNDEKFTLITVTMEPPVPSDHQ